MQPSCQPPCDRAGEGQGFKDFSWPIEQRFWDDLMYNSSQWGLFMYEQVRRTVTPSHRHTVTQRHTVTPSCTVLHRCTAAPLHTLENTRARVQDWLDTEYDNVMHLNLNATAARTWLLQMGSAAAKHGLTIQYCMSHCRHILQSVEIPAVTNARASGDYHPGNEQWQPLGNTAIFAWAVGCAHCWTVTRLLRDCYTTVTRLLCDCSRLLHDCYTTATRLFHDSACLSASSLTSQDRTDKR